MTKEVLEQAKRYDECVSTINKALKVLGKPALYIVSGVTADEFRFKELDEVTYRLLMDSIRTTLKARKDVLVNILERL